MAAEGMLVDPLKFRAGPGAQGGVEGLPHTQPHTWPGPGPTHSHLGGHDLALRSAHPHAHPHNDVKRDQRDHLPPTTPGWVTLLLCPLGSLALYLRPFPRTMCSPHGPLGHHSSDPRMPGGIHEKQLAFSSGKPSSRVCFEKTNSHSFGFCDDPSGAVVVGSVNLPLS